MVERVILQLIAEDSVHQWFYVARCEDVARPDQLFHSTPTERSGLKGFNEHGDVNPRVWTELTTVSEFIHTQESFHCIVVPAFWNE